MILRRSLLRHGRQLFPKPTRPYTRSLATEVDLSSIESSINAIDHELKNTTRQTEPISPQPEEDSNFRVIQHINPETQKTQKLQEEDLSSDFKRLQKSRNQSKTYGTTLAPSYEPSTLVTNPPRPSDITIPLLIASQAHLGHKTSHWNPSNSAYIFGIRHGIHIISPEVTASHLRRACRVVSGVALRGGIILFVGTRPGQDRCVVRAAQLAGGCHLFERWVAGTITNGHQLLSTCAVKAVNEFDEEVAGFEREIEERPVCRPDLVVVLNPRENWVLLHECALNAIPTIGVVDTDADPSWVTYPIPANDDSLRCVQVIAGVLGRAGEEGQRERKAAAAEGRVLYAPLKMKREGGGIGRGEGEKMAAEALETLNPGVRPRVR